MVANDMGGEEPSQRRREHGGAESRAGDGALQQGQRKSAVWHGHPRFELIRTLRGAAMKKN
jgi:hypothetical protein